MLLWLLTSLDLGLVLDAVIGLTPAQEVLTAAAGLHVLNTHVDALADDAAIHLQKHDMPKRMSTRAIVPVVHAGRHG